MALVLYKDMGRIIFIPMLFNMWFNLFLTFDVLQGWDFRWLAALQGVLFFIWVAVLAQVFRNKYDLAVVVILLASAFFIGTLPDLTGKTDMKGIIDATTRIWTVWDFSTFIIVLMVVIRSTIIAKIKKEFVDVLSNPRKRVMLPIGAFGAIVSLLPLLRGAIPESLIDYRFNLAALTLAWGWVILETPFYIMYERLKRQ
ncbi:hypothetical protein KKH18_01915 [bacterium]|nr:hypothetical protein [bacterium]